MRNIMIATPIVKRPVSRTFNILSPTSRRAQLIQRSVSRMPVRPTVSIPTRPGISITPRPSIFGLSPAAAGVAVGMPTRPTAALPQQVTRPSGAGVTGAAPVTGGGLSLGGITGDLSSIGGDITSKIQSFLPIAIKLGLLFIGIKILFWVLRGRR